MLSKANLVKGRAIGENGIKHSCKHVINFKDITYKIENNK